MFKKGQKNSKIENLQYRLKKVLNRNIAVDGDFGPRTEQAVKDFQKMVGLKQDGIIGPRTLAKLDEAYKMLHRDNSKLLTFGKPRFVVFVDAGHGGINDSGKYTTAGKKMHHPGKSFHEGGHYYEGYENRLIAEAFIEACTKAGIMCVRTYHPFKDTPLSTRTELVRSWLKRGYYGYLHSIHSNAISLSHSHSKLENTRGFIVFTTRGNSLSDKIADQHFTHVKDEFSHDWVTREQRSDGDSDYEANFQVLRQTDLKEFKHFGSILDEWGFHTSSIDTEFITRPENRVRRVETCLKTAKWVKNYLDKQIQAQ